MFEFKGIGNENVYCLFSILIGYRTVRMLLFAENSLAAKLKIWLLVMFIDISNN